MKYYIYLIFVSDLNYEEASRLKIENLTDLPITLIFVDTICRQIRKKGEILNKEYNNMRFITIDKHL